MKVVAGLYKGRNIEGYNIEGTRPTQDRVKENLFNIINENIQDKVVLDLFSGSGNLAIESLRKKNINNIGITNCKIINSNYKEALNYLIDNNIKLDIIFLDPPYKTNYIEESINIIIDNNLLNDKGLIICESDSIDKIVYPEELKCIKDKKYGDKYIIILKI